MLETPRSSDSLLVCRFRGMDYAWLTSLHEPSLFLCVVVQVWLQCARTASMKALLLTKYMAWSVVRSQLQRIFSKMPQVSQSDHILLKPEIFVNIARILLILLNLLNILTTTLMTSRLIAVSDHIGIQLRLLLKTSKILAYYMTPTGSNHSIKHFDVHHEDIQTNSITWLVEL